MRRLYEHNLTTDLVRQHYVFNGGESTPRYICAANGNMESRNDDTTTWTLDWTPENMLHTAVNTQNDTVNLIYNADGNLSRRTEAGQDIVYIGRIIRTQFNGRYNQAALCV